MTATSARTNDRRGRVRIEPGGKRVRAFLGGEVVADTTRPVLVWEVPYYPAYYVPLADVRAELRADGGTVHSPSRGDAGTFTVVAGGREAAGAALRYENSPIEGWQFVRLFRVRAGSGGGASVSWRPPTLGRWRLHATFEGSRSASRSRSGYAYLVVQTHVAP